MCISTFILTGKRSNNQGLYQEVMKDGQETTLPCSVDTAYPWSPSWLTDLASQVLNEILPPGFQQLLARIQDRTLDNLFTLCSKPFSPKIHV